MSKDTKGKVFGVIVLVFAAIAYFITDKMIVSILLSLVVTGVLFGLYSAIKSAAASIRNNENKKGAVKKIAVWSVVVISIISIFVGFVVYGSGHKPANCIKCGKHAMYTENGLCYSCYKEAERAVINSYNNY